MLNFKILTRNVLFVFFGFLCLPAYSQVQTKEEKEVIQAIETLRSGMISGDRKVLEKIAAPELTYGHSSGKIEDKVAFVEALASKKSDFRKIDLTNQTVKVAGNTALVRHNLAAETRDGGMPNTVKLHILLVWQKQSGQWKLLARQAVKI